MRCLLRATLTVLLAIAAAQASAGGIQLPRLADPPPPRQQVAEAEIWDPYAVPDLAPYNDGSRPRDFLYPPPKATRGRYPAPGTFPRPAPWTRSSAPADYPKVHKWWQRKKAAAQTQVPQPVPAQPVLPPAEEIPQA